MSLSLPWEMPGDRPPPPSPARRASPGRRAGQREHRRAQLSFVTLQVRGANVSSGGGGEGQL